MHRAAEASRANPATKKGAHRGALLKHSDLAERYQR
jgi:hypothetical protein